VIGLQDVLSNFLDLLQEEVLLCQRLLTILKEERKALVLHALEDIIESTKQKETCLLELKLVEASRRALVDRLARVFQMEPGELDLFKLCSMADLPYSVQLQTGLLELNEIARQIQDFNRKNRAFLQSSLGRVQNCLSFLSTLGTDKKTYQPTGEWVRPDGYGRLFKRSV
jgi:flagellar biosynthesis/type III secretory pathway chaperone